VGILLDILNNQILQHDDQADRLGTFRQIYFPNRTLKNPKLTLRKKDNIFTKNTSLM
jgi:hypothetical protein